MNTQAQQIVNSNKTKKAKILELATLGFTTQEIADMVGSGYGYVYVVLNYRNGEGPSNTQTVYAPLLFNRKFGIEIEAYGVEKQRLINELRHKGIVVYEEGYNHQTRVR